MLKLLLVVAILIAAVYGVQKYNADRAAEQVAATATPVPATPTPVRAKPSPPAMVVKQLQTGGLNDHGLAKPKSEDRLAPPAHHR